ncbi:MAG: hypothetical protein ACREN2_11295 [Candidatus Dormibacteria bacterium]
MSSPQLPLLGVLAAPDPPPNFAWLLRELGRWATPLFVEPESVPAAYIASSPRALGLAAALSSGKPVAMWIDDEDPDSAVGVPATLLLTGDADLARDRSAVLIPPDGGIDVDAIPPVAPFVRARIRRREGLPERMVVDLRTDSIPAGGLAPALTVCSACIAIGEGLTQALAWAAPTVTDSLSAERIGARPGVDVEVGFDDQLADLALHVAGDMPRAAALSRSGRRLIESSRGRRNVGARVATALGLLGSPELLSLMRVESALDALNTPESAMVRRRARLALKPFVVAS